MELKKVKEDSKTLLLEVAGETFTVTNALREQLWEDKSVSEAAQIREHPYLSNPKIFVVTKRGSPIDALERAAEKIVEEAKEFSAEFKKALKSRT
jgi:DNA-directed RNA polymerase subunit L